MLGRLYRYQSGHAAGTCTLPKGAILVQIHAHDSAGGGTISIFAGAFAEANFAGDGSEAVITIAATGSDTRLKFHELQYMAKDNAVTAGSQDIVFTGATINKWWVEYTIANAGAPH